MSDPSKTVSDDATTGEDLTIRPDTASTDGGATEEDFVPVGGPRSGDADQGGTEDTGIHPNEEITPG